MSVRTPSGGSYAPQTARNGGEARLAEMASRHSCDATGALEAGNIPALQLFRRRAGAVRNWLHNVRSK